MLSLLLSLSGIAVVLSQPAPIFFGGSVYRSVCYNKEWEKQTYGGIAEMANLPLLRLPVTVFLDMRFRDRYPDEDFHNAIANFNRVVAPAQVQLVDVQIKPLPASMLTSEVSNYNNIRRLHKANWGQNNEMRAALDSGRVVTVVTQMDSGGGLSTMAGLLVPQYITDAVEENKCYVFINIADENALALTSMSPNLDERTFAHELFHLFGLFHTFDSVMDGPCENDGIPDTPATVQAEAQCGFEHEDPCDNMRKVMDMSNVMSYGTCESGPHPYITEAQLRRVRCTIEQDSELQTVESGNGPVTTPPREDPFQPTFPSVMPTPAPAQPTPAPFVPSDPSLPDDEIIWTGARCAHSPGECMPDFFVCDSGNYVEGECPRPSRCCLDVGASPVAPPAPFQPIGTGFKTPAMSGTAVPIDDTIALSHPVFLIGSAAHLPPLAVLESMTVYLWPTATLMRPEASDLQGLEVEHFIDHDKSLWVEFRYYKDKKPVDRGQFVLVMEGTDAATGQSRQLLTTVFTVDAGGCVADAAQFDGVPFGVYRTEEACRARGDDIDNSQRHLFYRPLVCCVAAMRQRRIGNRAFAIEGNSTVVLRKGDVPPFDVEVKQNAPVVNASPAESKWLDLEWRGVTWFWGSKTHVRVLKASTERADLFITRPDKRGIYNEKPLLTVLPEDKDVALVVDVQPSNMGIFRVASKDGMQSPLVSVAALPCRSTLNNLAGYCYPTKAITDAHGTTDTDYVCDSGDLSPCKGLVANNVEFACCAGKPSKTQIQANFRMMSPASSLSMAATAIVVALAKLF